VSTQEFGRMVEEGMRNKGLSLRKLGALVGVLPDGRVVDATMIKRVIEGQRRSIDTHLAWRLIEELDLDRVSAAEAAGVWPPGVTAEMLRDLDLTRTGADKVLPGYHGVALPGLLDLDPDLIRRTRVERRRRDRRRRRPWIVPIELEKVAA
jgi:hypothetical protein